MDLLVVGSRGLTGVKAAALGSVSHAVAELATCPVLIVKPQETREAGMAITLTTVPVRKPESANVVLGQAHFIKTVEDLHEALVTAVPGIKFGLAFCEASEPCLVRSTGTDQDLTRLAQINAMAIGAGHSFIVLLRDCFPINVLPVLRQVPEVCEVFCATANPVEVVIAETGQGRGILGVIDGYPPKGVETEADIAERKALLRRFGYKL